MHLLATKNLWPSLNGFIGKFSPKYPKSLQKNHVFEFIDLKTLFKSHGTPNLFCFSKYSILRASKKNFRPYFQKMAEI